jgi:hypothetical protein
MERSWSLPESLALPAEIPWLVVLKPWAKANMISIVRAVAIKTSIRVIPRGIRRLAMSLPRCIPRDQREFENASVSSCSKKRGKQVVCGRWRLITACPIKPHTRPKVNILSELARIPDQAKALHRNCPDYTTEPMFSVPKKDFPA